MGGLMSLFSRNEPVVNLLVVGLDAAGKTTMLYKLKKSAKAEVEEVIQTIGFITEHLTIKNIRVTSWDTGGRTKMRPLYRHFYKDIKGIVYMLDSNDRNRFEEAGDELQKMIKEEELRGVPVLVLANKQDLPSAASLADLTEVLKLRSIRGREWHIEACCATSGDGLYEGLSWLTEVARKGYHETTMACEKK